MARNPQGVSGPSAAARLEAIRDWAENGTMDPKRREELRWLLARLAPATPPGAPLGEHPREDRAREERTLSPGLPLDIGYEIDCAMLEHYGDIDAGLGATITRRLRAAFSEWLASSRATPSAPDCASTADLGAPEGPATAPGVGEALKDRKDFTPGQKVSDAAPPAAGPRESSRLEGTAPEHPNPERPTDGGA